jgi:hypothetical protein
MGGEWQNLIPIKEHLKGNKKIQEELSCHNNRKPTTQVPGGKIQKVQIDLQREGSYISLDACLNFYRRIQKKGTIQCLSYIRNLW